MAFDSLEQLLIETASLSPSEQQELRDIIGSLPQDGPPWTKEELVEHILLRRGIISRIPPRITDYTPYANRKPIEIQGKPLSETIIEERR